MQGRLIETVMTRNPLIGVLIEELANSKRMLKAYRQALAALSKGKPPMGRGVEFKKAASK